MSDKYQEHPTKATALLQSRAVNVALGYPRRGANIGRGPHVVIPPVYTPGAVGWTASECEVLDDQQLGVAGCLVITDAVVALGKRDVTVDGNTVKVDFTKDVVAAKPAKFKKAGEAP